MLVFPSFFLLSLPLYQPTTYHPLAGPLANPIIPQQPDGWVDWGDKPSIAALVLSDHANQSENLAYINATEIQSAVSFTSPLTYAGYKDVPVSYLLCEGDRIIIPRAQREGIELIEKESGRKVDVYTTQAGHCPNFTAMGEVVEWVLHMARLHEEE